MKERCFSSSGKQQLNIDPNTPLVNKYEHKIKQTLFILCLGSNRCFVPLHLLPECCSLYSFKFVDTLKSEWINWLIDNQYPKTGSKVSLSYFVCISIKFLFGYSNYLLLFFCVSFVASVLVLNEIWWKQQPTKLSIVAVAVTFCCWCRCHSLPFNIVN